MAKRFVRVTLAAKCRILFGAATVLIIGAALVAPWLYMEARSDEKVLRAGQEITRLYHNEWLAKHGQPDTPIAEVAALFVTGDTTDVRRGPIFMPLDEDQRLPEPADPHAAEALKSFLREGGEEIVQVLDAQQGRRIHHIYRAVRVDRSCLAPACHDETVEPAMQFRLHSLKGMVAADLPGEPPAGSLMIARIIIISAGGLAFVLAAMTIHLITKRIILSPVRQLKQVADRVADGDLSTRSRLRSGDEFEQLGHSFNEMLHAVDRSQGQLRKANRALDLKLNELAESNVALYESNRLKSEFLANVSHELRTPLNSIIGFAELLSEMGDERTQRYAGNILNPAKMLLQIINDLLDLARIEAGKVKLTVTQMSVADICETLVSLVTPLAQKKKLHLTLHLEEGLPIVRTDAGKVQQILYNLLSNAIKFTPAGGDVDLSADHDRASGVVRMHVADTGPGISEMDKARIFEKFYQSDGSTTREHGGAGLGLAIAKDLADVLGGRLSLTGEPGKGTTFTLTLPVQIPSPEEM